MAKYCTSCGTQVEEGLKFCPNCGNSLDGRVPTNGGNTSGSIGNSEAKSKIVAGLLGVFLGGWGIHNFYLGFNNKAIIQIIVTIVTCGIGALWGFIEGILILVGNINVDANGNPLQD